MNLPPMRRPCALCIVGGLAGARHCVLRDAVRAETHHDVRCVICGQSPTPALALLSRGGPWYCARHYPETGEEAAP